MNKYEEAQFLCEQLLLRDNLSPRTRRALTKIKTALCDAQCELSDVVAELNQLREQFGNFVVNTQD